MPEGVNILQTLIEYRVLTDNCARRISQWIVWKPGEVHSSPSSRKKVSGPLTLFSPTLTQPRRPRTSNRDSFRASQINTLYGSLPLFVLSHIIVVPTFASVISDQFQTAMTTWWIALSIVPVALLIILWNHHARRRSPVASVTEIRWVELLGILFGLSWALFPAAFFTPADADLRVLIVAGTLAASAVGTFALSRVPAAAIIFCALITGSLSLSVMKLEGAIGLTSTFFTIAYGLILAGMVLNQHRDQLQKAVDAQEMHHQKDIIALLLNDFQLGTSDWLFECDANGSLTYVSTRLSEIVGRSPQNIKGLTLLDAAGADATQIRLDRTLRNNAGKKANRGSSGLR